VIFTITPVAVLKHRRQFLIGRIPGTGVFRGQYIDFMLSQS
jgi:hypothetical protein